jgi:hypothetical protein
LSCRRPSAAFERSRDAGLFLRRVILGLLSCSSPLLEMKARRESTLDPGERLSGVKLQVSLEVAGSVVAFLFLEDGILEAREVVEEIEERLRFKFWVVEGEDMILRSWHKKE